MTPDEPDLVDGRLIRKAIVGIVALLAVAGLCGLLLRAPLEAGATWFVDRFGLAGIFAGVLFADSSILPLTHEPILAIGIAGDLPPGPLLATACAASVLAGLVGYAGGALLIARTPLGPWIRQRWPGFATFVARYGVRGVAVAAVLPIPFSASTWSAGMMGLGLGRVMLASLLRVPKTAFYFALLYFGWAATA